MINAGRLVVLGEQYADHVVDHFPDHDLRRLAAELEASIKGNQKGDDNVCQAVATNLEFVPLSALENGQARCTVSAVEGAHSPGSSARRLRKLQGFARA